MGRKVVGRRAAGVDRRAADQKVPVVDQCVPEEGGAGTPRAADRTAVGLQAGPEEAR